MCTQVSAATSTSVVSPSHVTSTVRADESVRPRLPPKRHGLAPGDLPPGLGGARQLGLGRFSLDGDHEQLAGASDHPGGDADEGAYPFHHRRRRHGLHRARPVREIDRSGVTYQGDIYDALEDRRLGAEANVDRSRRNPGALGYIGQRRR
jgi:hypothetical protein